MRDSLKNLTKIAFLIAFAFLLTACTKTETKTEKVSIPYVTQKQNDANIWEGEEKVVQDGKNGEKQVTYKLIYKDGADQPPERENINEKIIKQPKGRIIQIGQKRRATGKKFVVDGVEFELLSIKRVSSSSYTQASGLNGSLSNGDYLELDFDVRNLSEEYKTIPSIALKQGGVVYFAPDMWYSSLAGDEEKKMMVPIILKYSQSVDYNKWLNTSVSGPDDLTLLADQRISETDGLWGTRQYETTRNLTDFWIGPFYGNQVSPEANSSAQQQGNPPPGHPPIQ